MRICFWGTYAVAEGYPVNRVLIKGLRQAGAVVEECREELWGGFLHTAFSEAKPATFFTLGFRALCGYLRLIWRYWRCGQHQCVIVGYAGYVDVLLARLLNLRRRPLVLVAFISLYDTIVVDRGQVPAGTWKARLLKRIDHLAFSSADMVLVDTQEHIAYFAELFELPVEKFHRSFVGEDDDFFRPLPPQTERPNSLQVLFFGTYVPLHGIDVVLDAATALRRDSEVEFTLIGNGQLYPQMRREAGRRGLDNIRFIDEWVGTAGLVEYIQAADICLGIFGKTSKAARVIPYKVFDALALGKPVITRDSSAIRELLEHGETAFLCEAGNGEQLARAILCLKNDPGLAARLASQGYARFRAQGSPRAIGCALLKTLEQRFGR